MWFQFVLEQTMEESRCVFLSEYYWGENEYVTRAGKTSRNAHRLIWATDKKVKNIDFGRIWGSQKSELSPGLAIPLLAIKNLNVLS